MSRIRFLLPLTLTLTLICLLSFSIPHVSASASSSSSPPPSPTSCSHPSSSPFCSFLNLISYHSRHIYTSYIRPHTSIFDQIADAILVKHIHIHPQVRKNHIGTIKRDANAVTPPLKFPMIFPTWLMNQFHTTNTTDTSTSTISSFNSSSITWLSLICITILLSLIVLIKIAYKHTHSRPRRACWFWLPAPSPSSSFSPSSTALVLPSPRPSPWFTSLLHSMDDVATITNTFHAWRRDWLTAWPYSMLSHNPSHAEIVATHHDDRIHLDSEDDIEAWKERINAIHQGIETARANIHMEEEDEKEEKHDDERKVSDTAPQATTDMISSTPVSSSALIDTVIFTCTCLCDDVTSHISSLPSILLSHITSIASSLSSTHEIITSSMDSFTWHQDRDELEKIVKTWRGNGNHVALKHLSNIVYKKLHKLLQPWKSLNFYLHQDVLEHLHNMLQTIIHDLMHLITHDMNVNDIITIYGYENIFMILYLLHELLPCQKHPITHVNLPHAMIHIMITHATRIRMTQQAHDAIRDIQQDDPSHTTDQPQNHLQSILNVIDHIQQARLVTQEMATTSPIIIPIPSDNDDSKSQSQFTAPAYVMWKKLLSQAQDDVTGIQIQLEKLQACKQDLSNHLTTEIAEFQSFTDRVDALRDITNESIQHMNGTLDTIMTHATRAEKCVIHAQQHVDLCHGWMVQQQTWYTTWIKQLDSSITSLQQQLTEQQRRITLLHHIHDSCLSIWKQITIPIDKAIDDAQKNLPQLDIQWNQHINVAEQVLTHHQQQIVTTTSTLQEKIQQTEEEWKQAQEQHNGCLATSLSSQLSMLREQLQAVKSEQEMWETLAKTLQEKKEAGTAVTETATENDANEVKTPTSSTSASSTPSSTTAASLTLSDSDLLDLVPPISASTPSPSAPIPSSFGRATSPTTPTTTPTATTAPALTISIPVVSAAIVTIDHPLATSHGTSTFTSSFDAPADRVSDPHANADGDSEELETFDPDSPSWNSELEVEQETTTQTEPQEEQQQPQTSTTDGVDTTTTII